MDLRRCLHRVRYSRFVLAWQLSNSLEVDFCLDALESSFQYGKPHIFNSDQGSQFTATAFTDKLAAKDIGISMDGRGESQPGLDLGFSLR
jgi:putative transposase